MSSNVKVYGSFNFAESCTFDPDRNVIVAMNAGNPRNMGSPPPLTPNDGFVSLINPGRLGAHVASGSASRATASRSYIRSAARSRAARST